MKRFPWGLSSFGDIKKLAGQGRMGWAVWTRTTSWWKNESSNCHKSWKTENWSSSHSTRFLNFFSGPSLIFQGDLANFFNNFLGSGGGWQPELGLSSKWCFSSSGTRNPLKHLSFFNNIIILGSFNVWRVSAPVFPSKKQKFKAARCSRESVLQKTYVNLHRCSSRPSRFYSKKSKHTQ